MSLVLGLGEITPADGERVGGKAMALASLEAAGQRVPRTLCLTTEAYQLFVEEASLRAVVHQELGRKSFADMRWEELWDVALRIRNRFLRAPIPPVIIDELATRLEMEVGSGPFAIRSSALGEDAPGASFAGLHDSYVGVQGPDQVAEAIGKVWSSLWTDRALLYRRELGIDVESSSMAVLVQEMIEGQTSGIVFGRHPSRADLAAIEAVYGLNQGLVDGTIEPDRWSLEQTSGRVVEHGAPEVRQRCVARDGELVIESVPLNLAALPPLDSRAIEAVHQAVRGAETIFGAAQDMEWTFRADDLVLLQSRPATTSPTGEGDKRSWYLSLTRSLESIEGMRTRVEQELLPAMVEDAEATADRDLAHLDPESLAVEIERRRRLHDHWVEIYSRDFIPLAHGVRIFGQFYNDTLKPDDPYSFMELLVATPLLSVRRNRAL